MSKKENTNLIKRLSCLSTPLISDTMGKCLSRQLKHQTLDNRIKPINQKFKVCGPAYTVQCYQGATYAMEKAVAEAPAGSVIVCNGHGSDAGVMMGGLMSTFAKTRGILGAVVDGAVRDIDEIIELGFPVFTRHITPRSGTFAELGDVEKIITCGNVVVRPGDLVAGDLNGVVVVPQEIIQQVTEAAEELAEFEDGVVKLLLQGKTLEEAAGRCKKPKIRDINYNG